MYGNGMRSLDAWLKEIGVTACTGWRWRRRGWLQTVNICGRVYVTAEAAAEFVERAKRGEFAQEHKVPRRASERGAHEQPA